MKAAGPRGKGAAELTAELSCSGARRIIVSCREAPRGAVGNYTASLEAGLLIGLSHRVSRVSRVSRVHLPVARGASVTCLH